MEHCHQVVHHANISLLALLVWPHLALTFLMFITINAALNEVNEDRDENAFAQFYQRHFILVFGVFLTS